MEAISLFIRDNLTASSGFVKKKIKKVGMAKEHRIPLMRIRCMAWDRYQKLRKLYKGRG